MLIIKKAGDKQEIPKNQAPQGSKIVQAWTTPLMIKKKLVLPITIKDVLKGGKTQTWFRFLSLLLNY